LDNQKRKAIEQIVDVSILCYCIGLTGVCKFGELNTDKSHEISLYSFPPFCFDVPIYIECGESLQKIFPLLISIIGDAISKSCNDKNSNVNLPISDKMYWNSACNDIEGYVIVSSQIRKTLCSLCK